MSITSGSTTHGSGAGWKQTARDLAVIDPTGCLFPLAFLAVVFAAQFLAWVVRCVWRLSCRVVTAIGAMEARTRVRLLGAGLSVLLFAAEALRLAADRPLLYGAGAALACVALLDARRSVTKKSAPIS